jgi:3D (Asp-Asp-Asp) domain-containing protein
MRNQRDHDAGSLSPLRKAGLLIALAVIGILLLRSGGCGRRRIPHPPLSQGRKITMTVTAYCPCGQCCGWERTWYGRPVYAYGSRKGKPKRVGICADGSRARKGVIAADTSLYPFGTVMHIPGYGYGIVSDRGGKIKGAQHIDIFFDSHKKALRWGKQSLTVTVFDR